MDKEYFKTVFMFFIAEPYAMGGGGEIAFMNESGDFRYMDYRSDEIVLFMNGGNPGLQTRVNEGWHHLYLGYGNHLVIRDDKWPEFSDKIAAFKKRVDIYGAWKEIAETMCKGGN